MEKILAIIFIFGGGTVFLLSLSPIGRALAERLRQSGRAATDPELIADVDALRQEVAELQDRVEFAERLLAQRQEPARIERGS